MESLEQSVIEAVTYIKSVVSFKPDIAIIIGDNFDSLSYEIQDTIEIPYEEIPYFKSLPGRDSKLIFGKIYDKTVVAIKNGSHYYDGFSMQDLAFPIRVFSLLGIEYLIIACQANGIGTRFRPGDLMISTDYINVSGLSPLIGPNSSLFGERFPSMKEAYSKKLMDITRKVSYEIGVNIQEGIYAYVTGPQGLTDAELKMLESFGANCYGMEAVPETIVANHSGMDVLCVSCINNVSGIQADAISHNEVLETASKVEESFIALILDTIKKIQ